MPSGYVCLLKGVPFLVLGVTPALFAADASVKVWEEQIVIPTYLIGAPERNSAILFRRSFTGRAAESLPLSALRQSHHEEGGQDLHDHLPRKRIHPHRHSVGTWR